MDFVVLARKLRPARFGDLIGQDTVVRALRNAILTDRVAHAFLFAGSRGVGKTSTARILTKALNCEQPADGEPCDACSNCREIALNTSPDVYEIDAASNRGIDNIRELRENTKYAPVKSRYKTYIIDEVHMLTMESFNALLKTLEEPPPHVKFILATTNPHRIPETIVSRCQRYDFARVPVPMLADYLGEVAGREGIALSRHALEAVARNAAGGVRDALTALDQVVSYAGAEAGDEQVLSILGLTDNREVYTLLGAVLDKSLPDALDACAAIRERGHDLGVLLEALIGAVKDFSLYVSLDGRAGAFAEHPPEALAFFAERRAGVSLDELQQLFYLLLEVEEQLKRSEFAQACFEMGLVKACRVEPLVGVSDLLAQVRALGPGEAPATAGSASSPATGAAAEGPSSAGGAGTGGAPPEASRAAEAGPPPAGARGSEFDRISARAKARARESGGAPSSGSGGGDRGTGDDPDEAEPAPPPQAGEPEPPPEPPPDEAPAASPGDFGSALPPDDGAPPPEDWNGAEAAAAPTRAAGPPPAGASAAVPPPAPPRHAASGDEGPAPETPAADAPADQGPALCDDPRWRACVEALAGRHPALAAKLRRAEVTALEDTGIAVLPADGHNVPSPDELETAAPFVTEAFGAAFPIRLADDTTKKARAAHTIAGRNRIAEEARLAARRAAAEQDAQVQRLLHHFPGGRIVDVVLSEEPSPPTRSEDV